jgi:hypothetical protein
VRKAVTAQNWLLDSQPLAPICPARRQRTWGMTATCDAKIVRSGRGNDLAWAIVGACTGLYTLACVWPMVVPLSVLRPGAARQKMGVSP